MRIKPESAFLTLRLLVYIVIATWIIFVLVPTYFRANRQIINYSKSPPPLDNAAEALEKLCRVTEETKNLRRSRKTIEVNPARQVVEELLQIVTKKPDENFCKKDSPSDKLAVVIVDSGRGHLMERNLIRETWGSLAKYRGWKVRTVFLMGQSDICISPQISNTNKLMGAIKEKIAVEKELKSFSDLVVGSFADTYRNLTYKHLMGYKFVLENCPEVDLIIKTDDDMFVDIPRLIDMREEELAKKDKSKVSDIYCDHAHDKPTRCQDCPNGKYFSTKEEWPEDTYPPYCFGNDFAITGEWAKKIYSVRHEGGFFWVDDVFIAGKLRKIAGEKFGTPAKERNIKGNVTDRRHSSYIEDNCRKTGEGENLNFFGIFVFLEREKKVFEDNFKCLWGKVLVKNEGLLVFHNV